jgi:hypothetical protein
MNDLVGFVLEDLGEKPPRRNALKLSGPASQVKLREFVQALVKTYGWRADFKGPNSERVPFVPPHFAAEMIGFFKIRADYWLIQSVPEGAKQPRFIRNHMQRATEVVGDVRGSKLISANEASFEAAPAEVASRAPANRTRVCFGRRLRGSSSTSCSGWPSTSMCSRASRSRWTSSSSR